jgi:hypothetical protein
LEPDAFHTEINDVMAVPVCSVVLKFSLNKGTVTVLIELSCGSGTNYIITYYYSSFFVPYVRNSFAAPKNFMSFIFGSLLIYNEYRWSKTYFFTVLNVNDVYILNSINHLMFVMVTGCVLFEVRTEFLNNI